MAVVQNLNEIYLDGTFYKLKPNTRVQRVKAPGYAPKMVIGDYSAESRPLVSVVKWSDLSGGMGIRRILKPEHMNRYWYSQISAQHEGSWTPDPLETRTTTPDSVEVSALGELPSGASNAGEVYAMFSDKTVHKYDNSGAFWTPAGPQLVIHACDAAWDESVDADVTVSVDTSDKKEGTGANQFVVAAGASAGDILATDDFAAKDLSTYDTVDFWIRCSVTTTAGQLQLLLDDTASCVSPLETLNVPALTANTWKRCRVALAVPGSDTAIISVGLKYTADIGACTIKIDDIRVTKAFTSATTDVCNARVNGTYYLVFACNSANTVWSSDGSTWTDNAQDSQYVCAWNDQLWGITNAGQLWYTADMSTFTNDAVLPTPTGSIRGLVVGRDAGGEDIIYAWTTFGLFAHDFANARFVQVFPIAQQRWVGKPINWRDTLLLPHGMGCYQYTPSALVEIGVDRDGSPGPNRLGHLQYLVGDLYRVFAFHGSASDPSSGNNFPELRVYDGRGWHFAALTPVNDTPRALLLSSAYNTYRLWYGVDNSGVNTSVWYIPVAPGRTPLNESRFSVQSSGHSIRLPWFDAFQPDVTKTMLTIKIHTSNLANSDIVEVLYYLNYGLSTFESAFQVDTTNGNTVTTFTPSNLGRAFQAISFRIDITRDSSQATNCPIIHSVAMEYLKVVDPKWQFACEIDLSAPARDTTSARGLTPDAARKALITSLEKALLLEFTYRDSAKDASETFYVMANGPALTEQTGIGENAEGRLILVEP